MTGQLGVCRSCGAEILWAKTARGTSMPIDRDPVDDGNVVLDGDGNARYLRTGEDWPGERYYSHFVRCPDRDKWRR